MNMIYLEDDLVTRKYYKNFLLNYFDNVFEASNANEAFEHLKKQNDIRFLLVDIELPLMNGLSFIEKVREENTSVKIVVLSSYDNKEYLMKALNFELSSYLIKPITRQKFKEMVFKIISSFKDMKTYIYLEDNYKWDFISKKLFHNEEEIKLTVKEQEIFSAFCKNDNIVFTYEDLSNLLYENDKDALNKVRMVIKRLKSKVNSKVLKTIYSVGYQFNIKLTKS